MRNGLSFFAIIIVTATFGWVSCSSANTGTKPPAKPPVDTTKTTASVYTAKYKKLSPFGVDYATIDASQTGNYNLIIAEPSAYDYDKTKVKALKSNGAQVLAYLSVGEVGPYRYYYKTLKKRGFLGKSKNWNAYFLNLADSVTYNLFFKTIIPRIMKNGFDGLFLDTVDDVAPYTSRSNQQSYMVKLINQIRSDYPDITVIQNDGLFLLDKTADAVDAVLKEDVATHYDFSTKSYALRKKKSYKSDVKQINQLSKKYHMPFLIIDYAVNEDLRASAKARLDTLPYPYFMTNIELNNLSNATTGNNY